VEVSDPFDMEKTQETLLLLLEEKGPKVLILKQMCALSPEKKLSRKYEMTINEDMCLGEDCGCNRLCTRIFRCPGLVWDKKSKTARIDEILCTGCGACASICPANAILKKEPEKKTVKEAAV
jgi:indolepyruvate ferredoxin oxidoreductase alpha subunit